MTKTYVIVHNEKDASTGKNRTLYFYEYTYGIPLWGENKKEAQEFSAKEKAKIHLPTLRKRKTIYGTHYKKGVKIIPK